MPVDEENNEDPNCAAALSETPLTSNHNIETGTGENDETGDAGQKGEVAIDESSRLRELEADIRDQDDLERDIGRQVDLSRLPWQLRYGN